MNALTSFRIHFPSTAIAAAAAVLALALAAAPAAQAEIYHVYGQVYASAQALPGTAAPYDPLQKYKNRVVRESEDLYAVAPKSMTRVSLFDAAGQAVKPAFVAVNDGWYHFSFQHAGSSRKVRFAVHDAATGEQLLRSGEMTVAEGHNLRFLLVPASPYPAGRPRPSPDADTALFTRVGKIEVDLIDRQSGLVTVKPPSRARKLAIPTYQQAPFGGNLFLFGAFSKRFYPGESGGREYCYQILIDGKALADPLYKTRYTVNTSSGVVTAKSVKLGPHGFGLLANCYRLTPMSEPGNVFWSFPDLLAIWRTGGRDTKKPVKVTFELYQTADRGSATFGGSLIGGGSTGRAVLQPTKVNLVSNQNDTLSLRLNNQRPAVDLELRVGGTSVVDCDILDLSGRKELEAFYEVDHPFLRAWALRTQSNRRQPGTASRESPKTWESGGPVIDQTVEGEKKLALPHSCAYNFWLHAWALTTNGYGYLYGASVEETHYVKAP